MDDNKIIISGTELLDAGFKVNDDPQFIYEFSLRADDEEDPDVNPALLWDNISSRFCVTDGEIMFIYINATSSAEAIEWASKISHFEEN